MTKIDLLTGATWERERSMYVRYHGLTETQAETVLTCTTHLERDNLCEQYRRLNNGKGK